MLFRVRHTDIPEHIASSDLVSFLVAHRFLSLAICAASGSRCLMNSTSRRGVSRPVFDFFWKALRTYTQPAYLNVYTARNVSPRWSLMISTTPLRQSRSAPSHPDACHHAGQRTAHSPCGPVQPRGTLARL